MDLSSFEARGVAYPFPDCPWCGDRCLYWKEGVDKHPFWMELALHSPDVVWQRMREHLEREHKAELVLWLLRHEG